MKDEFETLTQSRELTVDDLSFVSTSRRHSTTEDFNRNPSVYFDEDRKDVGAPSEEFYLGEMPASFNYFRTAFDSRRHTWGVDATQPTPPELALMLRCLSVGYRAGLRAGRKQAIAMGRLLAGGGA